MRSLTILTIIYGKKITAVRRICVRNIYVILVRGTATRLVAGTNVYDNYSSLHSGAVLHDYKMCTCMH